MLPNVKERIQTRSQAGITLVVTAHLCLSTPRANKFSGTGYAAERASSVYKWSMIRLGYPAQNLTIPASTNRTLRLANLGDAEKVRALVWENLLGLETILRWNAEHGIELFRMGQSLIPFASHPAFPYDWEDEHGDDLRDIGQLARSLGIRLSMHPGQFIQPGSLRPGVSERSLTELRYVARVFDLLGSSDSVIVLHMGGAYEDRAASTARFVEAMRSETGVLRYLALENDERVWPVADIVQTARSLGVPVITDAFHHGLNPGSLTLKGALDLSLSIWEVRGARPKVHLSSQDPEKQAGAHAYSVDLGDWYALLDALDGRDADVMVEAKGKEQALVPLGVGIR
jgi:UV DNA damage endonuclease